VDSYKRRHALTRLFLFLALSAGGFALVAWSAAFPFTAKAQGVDVRVTELDCNGDPELVAISNFGATAVEMTGWNLQSDPTDKESLPLSEFGSLSPGETLFVKAGPSADRGLVWSQEFVFRDNDPTDFAQLASDAGDVLLKVNCGTPLQQTATPGPSAAPSVAPTALTVAEAPTGGGAPEAAAGMPPALIIALGSGLITAGLGTFSLPLAGWVRRRRSNVESTPDPVLPARPRPEQELPRGTEASDDPLRPYLFLAVMVLVLATVAIFLLQPGEKKPE